MSMKKLFLTLVAVISLGALLVLLLEVCLLTPDAGAALPGQLQSDRMTNSTPGNQIDNKHVELEQFLIDVFGYPDKTDITAGVFNFDALSRITQSLIPFYAAGPVGIRLHDTDTSTEVYLAVDGDYFWISENTGSWASPSWTQRFSINLQNGAARIYQNLDVVGTAAFGSTVQRSGNELWGPDNDGSGTGLDADTLDGNNSTDFQLGHYIRIVERESDGVDGGTFLSGGWRVRDITHEEADVASQASIDAGLDQFTLQTGIWHLRIDAGAHRVDEHQAILYDVTNATVVGFGTSAFAAATGGMSYSTMSVWMDVNAPTTYEVRHYCGTSRVSDGFGIATTDGVIDEYYMVIEGWRIAP